MHVYKESPPYHRRRQRTQGVILCKFSLRATGYRYELSTFGAEGIANGGGVSKLASDGHETSLSFESWGTIHIRMTKSLYTLQSH